MLAIAGWVTLREGNAEEALKLIRAAADRENGSVTDGDEVGRPVPAVARPSLRSTGCPPSKTRAGCASTAARNLAAISPSSNRSRFFENVNGPRPHRSSASRELPPARRAMAGERIRHAIAGEWIRIAAEAQEKILS
jgi:hypothetical protein